MKILAIDTTVRVIYVSLLSEGKIFSIEKNLKLGQYQDTLSLIKVALKKSRTKIEEINYFGVCNGPGSFTGMRIGLSLVKALAYSLNRPVVTYKSLDLLAWSVKDKFSDLLCVMQDARRGNIYSAVYKNSANFKRITPYSLTDIKQLLNKLSKISKKSLKIYFYGDAALCYKEDIQKVFPNYKIIRNNDAGLKGKAMISWLRNNLSKQRNSFEILPFYMYPRDCQVSKPKNELS